MQNGEHAAAELVELGDRVLVGTAPADDGASGQEVEFEVVGIVEDPDDAEQYAVCYNEGADEFIVTDPAGQLIADGALAQNVLDDFLAQADEPDEGG